MKWLMGGLSAYILSKTLFSCELEQTKTVTKLVNS